MIVVKIVRAAVGLVVLVLVLVLLTAGPAAAETELEITTPADGRYQPGQPTPLLVTISADRAISGALTATFEGFVGGSQLVEVPGGSAKEVVLIVTAPPWAQGGSVSFVSDNKENDASARLGLTANREDELVAVFPDLAAGQLPATAALTAEVGQARLYAFDPDLLVHGPDVLSPFSHVVVTADDLDGIGPDAVATIEAWVGASGGVLVVDEPPSTPLPLASKPAVSGNGRIDVGTGTVAFTDGAIARGGYDGVLSPSPTRSTDDFPWSGGGGAPTTLTLARDAGVSIPAIGSLMLLLLAYVLIAGPVVWVLLRRSRREPLLWLIVPAIALITTLGVYGVGRALREDAVAAHTTVVADLPNIRAVSTQVLVSSSNGGRAGVELPDGWRTVQAFSEEVFFEGGPFGGGLGSTKPVVIDGALVADLPPGGIGVMAAESSTLRTGDASWAIDLADVDGQLKGTVTNLTEHTLEDAFISAGQGYQRLNSIEPGESVDVTLANPHVPPLGNDRMMESLWQEDPWNPSNTDSSVNPGMLIEWLGRQPLIRSPGFVLVGGWTKEAGGPLSTINGQPVESGRTVFLTADRVAAGLGGEPYRLELLRGWNSTRVSDPVGRDECGDLALTLRLAIADRDAVGTEPVLDVSRRGVVAFDLWDGSAWVASGMGQAQAERVIIGVPASALVGDELYLRVQLSCDAFGFANPFPDLRAAETDDLVLTVGALEEEEGADA